MVIEPSTLISAVVAIVVAIFGSAGFWQYVAEHSKSGIRKMIAELRQDLEKIKATEEERETRNARRRILRFNDELLNQRDLKHSKEMFDDILDDVTRYRNYCQTHPGFQNGKATLAIENVEQVYRKCMANHTFL